MFLKSKFIVIEGRVGLLLAKLMQVAFSPQSPITAPGMALRDQLTYPDHKMCGESHLLALLKAVHLEHLLRRVQHDFDKRHDWQGTHLPIRVFISP